MAARKAPPGPQLSRERAAELLSEVQYRGPGETPATICARFGVSTRTLQRWKAQESRDPEIAALVLAKKKQQATGWRATRVRFLRNAIEKLDQLVSEAKVADIRLVAGAIKIVGDLEVVSRGMGSDDEEHDEQPRADRQGQGPQADKGRKGADPSAAAATSGVH